MRSPILFMSSPTHSAEVLLARVMQAGFRPRSCAADACCKDSKKGYVSVLYAIVLLNNFHRRISNSPICSSYLTSSLHGTNYLAIICIPRNEFDKHSTISTLSYLCLSHTPPTKGSMVLYALASDAQALRRGSPSIASGPYWALMVPRAYVASLSYRGELGHISAAA